MRSVYSTRRLRLPPRCARAVPRGRRASSVSAIRRRWPSGALVSSNAASSPFEGEPQQALHVRQQRAGGAQPLGVGRGRSGRPAAVRRSISAGCGSRMSGRAAAWRSARYWATKSMSNRPPGRCLKSHGLLGGACWAMRSRMSATSRTSAAGSRGRQSVALTMCAAAARPARPARGSRARASAPCAPRSRPTARDRSRSLRANWRAARRGRTGAAACRPRRARPRW